MNNLFNKQLIACITQLPASTQKMVEPIYLTMQKTLVHYSSPSQKDFLQPPKPLPLCKIFSLVLEKYKRIWVVLGFMCSRF
jgi:hypothetical protein